MKKILALLLALVMVFALAACGGDSGTSDEKEEGKSNSADTKTDGVKGDWTGAATIDMGDGVTFKMHCTLSFDDDSYEITIDEDKTLASYEDVLDSMEMEEAEKEAALQLMSGNLNQSESGEYEYKDGVLTMDGEEAGRLEDGKLILDMDGEEIEFKRG